MMMTWTPTPADSRSDFRPLLHHVRHQINNKNQVKQKKV